MLAKLTLNKNEIIVKGAIVGCSLIGLTFLKKYCNGGQNYNHPDLTGKIAIITGGYAGIGYETALGYIINQQAIKGLAKLKATVIICARITKWRQALEITHRIKLFSNNTNVFYYPLDLDDLDSIKKFVQDFKNNHNRLDILVNNAGVMWLLKEERTKQNIEMQFGVNHVAHFSLTMSLLDIIKKTPDSRVINVSSKAFSWANFNFQALKENKTTLTKYSPSTAYGNSKLANILFTKFLQNLLQNNQVKIVCLHPGVIRTNLSRHVESNCFIKGLKILLYPIYWLLTKSAKQGAQTSLYCSTEEFQKLEGGAYYADCKVKQIQHRQLNSDSMQTLWDLTQEICKENEFQF